MIKNQVKLFAFVGLVFFPFVVNWLLKDAEDYDLSKSDVNFINAYKQVWRLILFWLILIILLYIVGIWFKLGYLFSIINLLLTLLFTFLVINIFFLFSDRYPLGKTDLNIDIKTEQIDWMDINLLFAYTPFLNYYLWLKWNKKYEYYLKESNLFWFVLVLVGMISFFYPLYNLFYLILLIIIVRFVSLFVGVDFPVIRQFVNNFYEKFPQEILIYVEAWGYYLINNLFLVIKWKSTIPYNVYFKQIKKFCLQGYHIENILKKTKKYLFLVLSYLAVIFFFWWILYKNLIWTNYVIIFSVVWISYYLLLSIFLERKVYPIPLISLLIFYILKKF